MTCYRWRVGIRRSALQESVIEVEAANQSEAIAVAKHLVSAVQFEQSKSGDEFLWDDEERIATVPAAPYRPTDVGQREIFPELIVTS